MIPVAQVPSYAGADDEGSGDIEQGNYKCTNMPPKELFLESMEATRIMCTELMVSALVGLCLFPHIKLLCNPMVELIYSQNARSICGIVLLQCSPPINVKEHDWWEYARKWIKQQVSVLQSNKNTNEMEFHA